MKYLNSTLMLSLLSLALSAVCFAQEADPQQAQMMNRGMMMGSGKDGGMGCMHPMMGMMGMMSSMVSTKDGGVVVKIGNTLYKYDKNLTFVKKVEIPIDIQGMQRMMKNLGIAPCCKPCGGNPPTPGAASPSDSHHPPQ